MIKSVRELYSAFASNDMKLLEDPEFGCFFCTKLISEQECIVISDNIKEIIKDGHYSSLSNLFDYVQKQKLTKEKIELWKDMK